MFDISFTEILVIAIIALVVLGPERLPQVARTLGHLFGRAQRYVNDVKSDIHREMELDELRKLKISVQEAAHSLEGTVQAEINQRQGVTETDSIATTSVAALGISIATSPLPDSLATPAKPAKPLVQLNSNPADAAGTDTAHS